MRLRQRDLNTYYVKPASNTTGTAGGKKTTYGTAVAIQAKIQPGSGRAMSEQYGERLGYILKMFYEGSVAIKEGDGICVNVASSARPDYKVVAIYPWDVKSFDLEKVI